MKSQTKNKVYLALAFVAAATMIVYFMPRMTRNHYTYEENRPRAYSTPTK